MNRTQLNIYSALSLGSPQESDDSQTRRYRRRNVLTDVSRGGQNVRPPRLLSDDHFRRVDKIFDEHLGLSRHHNLRRTTSGRGSCFERLRGNRWEGAGIITSVHELKVG